MTSKTEQFWVKSLPPGKDTHAWNYLYSGPFQSRAMAEQIALQLIESGQAKQVRVVDTDAS